MINNGTKWSDNDDMCLSMKMGNKLMCIREGVVSRIGVGFLRTILRGHHRQAMGDGVAAKLCSWNDPDHSI